MSVTDFGTTTDRLDSPSLADWAAAVAAALNNSSVPVDSRITNAFASHNATSDVHTITQVTGLQPALTTLQTNIDGKAATSHTHVVANVTGLQTSLDGLQTSLNGKASTVHPHTIADVTGLQDALDNTLSAAHTHDIADTNGLQTALDGKAATVHTHTIANVTNLQTTLDGKAATTHGHAIADVTNLQTSLDGKAATSHAHTISNVTNLQTVLDGKSDSTHNHDSQYLSPSEVLAGSNVTIDTTSTPGSVIINSTATGGSGTGTSLGWVNVKVTNSQSGAAQGNGSTVDRAAINQAAIDAGVGGVVFFPKTSGGYMIDQALNQPLERQLWIGCHSPLYDWDDTPSSNCMIRATSGFTGTSLIQITDPATCPGVTMRNLAFVGRGDTTGTINGIDFGPASGRERGWMIDKCQFMLLGGAALSGHMWVIDVRDSHISRCGYGIRPASGLAGNACKANDNRWTGNQIYMTYHHGIAIDSSGGQSGGITMDNNRVERAGVSISGSTMNPDSNRDQNAAGIYLTNVTGMTITNTYTDANAHSGLWINATAFGNPGVNTITCSGNIWRRDATGDNATTMRAGVTIVRGEYITFVGDQISYGVPNDSTGTGYYSPQYGLSRDSCQFVDWIGNVQLQGNTNTRNNGYRNLATYAANYMCQTRDARGGIEQLPALPTSSAPANPQNGYTYVDTTTNQMTWYSNSAWRTPAVSGTYWGMWSGTQAAYDALGTYSSTTLYVITG